MNDWLKRKDLTPPLQAYRDSMYSGFFAQYLARQADIDTPMTLVFGTPEALRVFPTTPIKYGRVEGIHESMCGYIFANAVEENLGGMKTLRVDRVHVLKGMRGIPPLFDRWWLSLNMGYLPVKIEKYNGPPENDVKYTVTVKEFIEVRPGLWAPVKGTKVSKFRYDPTGEEGVEVKEIQIHTFQCEKSFDKKDFQPKEED